MSGKRWALFLSGRGSTAQSALDVLPHLDFAMVVSSKADAPGLQKARRMGVSHQILTAKIDWPGLTQDLRRRRVTHLFLLGFMRLLPAEFVQAWQGRIFNVHPSLLPAFPGAHAIRESYQARAPMGVTVHEVITAMDAGPRKLQSSVPISSFEAPGVPSEVVRRIAQTEQRLIRHWVDRV